MNHSKYTCGCEGCNDGQCNAGCALTCMVPLISSADASAGTRVLGQATTSAGTYVWVPAGSSSNQL